MEKYYKKMDGDKLDYILSHFTRDGDEWMDYYPVKPIEVLDGQEIEIKMDEMVEITPDEFLDLGFEYKLFEPTRMTPPHSSSDDASYQRELL